MRRCKGIVCRTKRTVGPTNTEATMKRVPDKIQPYAQWDLTIRHMFIRPDSVAALRWAAFPFYLFCFILKSADDVSLFLFAGIAWTDKCERACRCPLVLHLLRVQGFTNTSAGGTPHLTSRCYLVLSNPGKQPPSSLPPSISVVHVRFVS